MHRFLSYIILPLLFQTSEDTNAISLQANIFFPEIIPLIWKQYPELSYSLDKMEAKDYAESDTLL